MIFSNGNCSIVDISNRSEVSLPYHSRPDRLTAVVWELAVNHWKTDWNSIQSVFQFILTVFLPGPQAWSIGANDPHWLSQS